jgi:hypothetical protein
MPDRTLVAGGLAGIEPADVHDQYRRRGADSWSDRALVAAAGAVIATPRAAPANSFVLHAPLELLARAGLLTLVELSSRQRARVRIAGLAARFAAAGDPVDPVDPPSLAAVASVEATASDLAGALASGDLDAIDRSAVRLGTQATASDLRRLLAEVCAPSLAAAGHAAILLYLLPRFEAARDVPLEILRGPARELGRQPGWRLRWFDAPGGDATGRAATGRALADALLDVPMLGTPGSDFIYPIMNQAEASGIAAELLSEAIAQAIDVTGARRAITRVAAWSMLQEPPQHAPYGWTHCLTMPQAVMGLAGDGLPSRLAVAIAGTYVVGFRAALGREALDPSWRPAPPETTDLAEALAAGPHAAAATTWYAPDPELDTITSTLATRASLHHDAHLVKYTLACLDAAAADPSQRRLYLAAGASLSAWWGQQPSDGFFDDA